MRTSWVLYVKEVKSLFSSWIAYVALIAFTLLNGVSFYIMMQAFDKITSHSSDIETGLQRTEWNMLDYIITPLYQTVFVLLFVMIPAITMRLFAEEKKQRTEELLLTSPIRTGQIVLSKYLAAATLITLMLLPVGMFPWIAGHYGKPSPDAGTMFTGYLALFLVGYSLAAIGLFASSLTENQIVAFILAVAIEMMFFIVARATITFDVIQIGDYLFNLGYFLRAFSITEHFQPLLSGLIRLSDVVYFASLTGFWLWATRHSAQSARWTG